MQKQTASLLRAAIAALDAAFETPPEELRQHCPDPEDESPLLLRFGPDIESYVIIDGYNIYKQDILGFSNPAFELAVTAALDRNVALYKPYDGYEPVSRDGKALEIRLAPQKAAEICASYLTAQRLLTRQAAKHQGQVFFGNGHWHLSLRQGERDLLFRQNADLTQAGVRVAAGIITWQRLLPALFIKPSVAEMENISNNMRYTGPERLYLGNSALASLRPAHRQKTLENRLALHAPYQPVYLTMAAASYGLRSDDAHLTASLAALSDHYKAAQHPVAEGHGTYLNHLNLTLDNLAAQPLIPPPLARALLTESLRSYREYLLWPAAQLHPARDRAALDEGLDVFAAKLDRLFPPPPAAARRRAPQP